MTRTNLTIIIPTYNRCSKLLKTVEILKSQTSLDYKLVILDNASTDDTEEKIKHYLDTNIFYVRNKFNIGATANFLRGLEYCETEYIWILGDDDAPEIDAVENIYLELEKYVGVGFINFASISERINPMQFVGIGEFIEGIDSFSNILFMSTGIYRTSLLTNNVRFAYHHSYNMAPFFTMLISYDWRDEVKIVLSCKKIVTSRTDQDLPDRWSHFNLNLGLVTLMESSGNMSKDLTRIFARKILFSHFLSPQTLCYQLINTYGNKKSTVRDYIYYQTVMRYFPYSENKIKYFVRSLFYFVVLSNFISRNYIYSKLKQSNYSWAIPALGNRL